MVLVTLFLLIVHAAQCSCVAHQPGGGWLQNVNLPLRCRCKVLVVRLLPGCTRTGTGTVACCLEAKWMAALLCGPSGDVWRLAVPTWAGWSACM